jgi:dTDP-4-dehydrorhamnose 3,5-epimerase
MRFMPTGLEGLVVVEPEPHADERGSFMRLWDIEELARRGHCERFVQCNMSTSRRAGTLRGMHFQTGAHAEVRLVSCVAGALYDVAVDLRDDSPTFKRWYGVELSAANRRALLVPKGFAHGFLTLADDTAGLYHMSAAYEPEASTGVRFDDPAFGIAWPAPVAVINARDRAWPDFQG